MKCGAVITNLFMILQFVEGSLRHPCEIKDHADCAENIGIKVAYPYILPRREWTACDLEPCNHPRDSVVQACTVLGRL